LDVDSVHHVGVDCRFFESKGGDGDLETNGDDLCKACNDDKSDSMPVTAEEAAAADAETEGEVDDIIEGIGAVLEDPE